MHRIKLSQGFVFLDSRVVIEGPALSTALGALLTAHGHSLTDATYELEPTVALTPEEVPALLVRVPPFAFVAHGELADALTTALATAIAALAAQDAAEEAARAALPRVRRQATRTILDRLTPAESAALLDSANVGIRLLVLKAVAEGFIRDDDPDFPAARAGLAALGIIAAARWDALFAP
jgi:hypothetical protein